MIAKTSASMCLAVLGALLAMSSPEGLEAHPVGERSLAVTVASAAFRHVDRGSSLAVTVWYPAAMGTKESAVVIGPPDAPLFSVAATARNAVPAPGRRPVILLSHGFGGSAHMIGWLGAAFAKAGYIVVSVDHPGNSDGDMSLAGAIAIWERPRDLIAALKALEGDATFGSLIDPGRVGAAGFSMGATTALALGGARFEPVHQDRFCESHPTEGSCALPLEMNERPDMTRAEGSRALGLLDAEAHAGDGGALPTVRAVLAIAPNVQTLAPSSMGEVKVPTVIVVGTADDIVPIATQSRVAAKSIGGARMVTVAKASHYSFLATCTELGRTEVPVCRSAAQQPDAHRTAIDEGLKLFATTLGSPD